MPWKLCGHMLPKFFRDLHFWGNNISDVFSEEKFRMGYFGEM